MTTITNISTPIFTDNIINTSNALVLILLLPHVRRLTLILKRMIISAITMTMNTTTTMRMTIYTIITINKSSPCYIETAIASIVVYPYKQSSLT